MHVRTLGPIDRLAPSRKRTQHVCTTGWAMASSGGSGKARTATCNALAAGRSCRLPFPSPQLLREHCPLPKGQWLWPSKTCDRAYAGGNVRYAPCQQMVSCHSGLWSHQPPNPMPASFFLRASLSDQATAPATSNAHPVKLLRMEAASLLLLALLLRLPLFSHLAVPAQSRQGVTSGM